MKTFALILFSVFFTVIAYSQIGTGVRNNNSFTHSGVMRSYNVYKPNSYNSTTKVPLVIVLHPGIVQEGDTMNLQMERYTHFDLVADTANFLIAYPNSRKDVNGIDPDWAIWDYSNTRGWNDVSFINTMMDKIIQDYNIDTCKIYITGFSMGGYLSYSMACESGNRLAAIAPVSGHKDHSYNCSPTNAVPVFHIHGDLDVDAKYYGDLSQDLDSVATVLRLWYNYNNCNSTPVISQLPNISTNDNTTITKYYYAPLSSDNEVIHYKVNGGGHGWPGALFSHPSEVGWNNMDVDASVEIWKFFRRHKLCTTTIGIEELANNRFKIFPNPTTQKVTIESNIAINEINFFTIDGKLLLKTTETKSIDVSTFPSGLIIIEIYGDNGEIIHNKLLKK